MTRPATYAPLTIADGLRSAAGRHPGKVALREGSRELTYAELVDRMSRVANATRHGAGLARGDRAAILAPSCLEYIEIVAGVAAAGCATATVTSRASTAEVEAICADAGARLLFVHPSLEEHARSCDLPAVETIVVLGAGYEAWLAAAAGRPSDVVVEEWDPFCIPYTSGTTGNPKGVLISHRSRILNYFGMSVEYECYGRDDSSLAVAPLYHGAGLSFAIAPIFFGGTAEIVRDFDPEALLRRLCDGAHTSVFMVPSHFHALFSLAPSLLERLRPPALRTIISNAAPLSQAMKERIVDYFGAGILYECYGSTEASIVSNLRPADQLRKERSVGLPFPCTEVRLLGEDGDEVAVGEIGELYSRSPFLFNGYHDRPEETAAAMRDGWFSAGDLARRDDEGYLYIVDRKNDKIISGGVNIYPREIEEPLARHPDVLEVAAFGVPDERWGEAVSVAVVLRPGATVTPQEIVDATTELPRYKRPKHARVVDALPRNASGKVLRRELRG